EYLRPAIVTSHCGHGSVHSSPQVHRVQFVATARLEVQKQLCPIRGASTEHHIYDECSATCFSTAEKIDLGAQVRVRQRFDQLRVSASLLLDGAEHLIKVHCFGLGGGCLKCGSVELAGGGSSNQHRSHHNQVLQQLERAALLGRWTIIELVAVDLARKME